MVSRNYGGLKWKSMLDSELTVPERPLHLLCSPTRRGQLSVASPWKWGSPTPPSATRGCRCPVGKAAMATCGPLHRSACVLRAPLGQAVLWHGGGVGEPGSLGQAPGLQKGRHTPLPEHMGVLWR